MANASGYASRVSAQHTDDRDPAALRRFAIGLLEETDPLVLRHVQTGLRVSAKPDATLVTQADTEVETLIRDPEAQLPPPTTTQPTTDSIGSSRTNTILP